MASDKFFTIVLATALIVSAGGSAAMAQSTGGGMKAGDTPHPSRTFSLLDTNGDGKVSLAEIRAEQARLITAADLDGDGKLSVDEFRRRGWWFQRLQTTTLFDLMDTNGDQILTAEEIANPSARWFKRYDKDTDGGVTVEEVPHFNRGGRGHRKHR